MSHQNIEIHINNSEAFPWLMLMKPTKEAHESKTSSSLPSLTKVHPSFIVTTLFNLIIIWFIRI